MRHLLVGLAVLGCTAMASAQPSTPPTPPASPAASPSPSGPAEIAQRRIDQLFTVPADASWFAAVFLAQVSTQQLDAIVAQLKAALGTYHGAQRSAPGVFIARFDKGTDEVHIHIDAEGKIDGLFLKPPVTASLNDALRGLAAVPHVSYVLMQGASQRAGLDPDRPLAIGSAFKLAVLSALREQIAAHERSWDDIVRLDPALRSLPSGVLRTWPAGTPVTIATLATEMIPISDNMAADTLRALVAGPDLDRYASRNRPFLSTRAMFVMKADTGADLLRRWQRATTEAQRAAVLAETERRPLPDIAAYPTEPRALDVEWLFSARELCALMAHVADLPLMSVNPGVVDPNAFTHVAFKGGSEPGVVNLTTSVTTKTGTAYCLSATVNDPEHDVDTNALAAPYAGVLYALASS